MSRYALDFCAIMMLYLTHFDAMRTTVEFDPDVLQLIREATYKTQATLKAIVNNAVRADLLPRKVHKPRFTQMTFDMGRPLVDLTKANALAAELEDNELIAKMQRGA
jgi:hypothetical protein